MAKKSKGKNKRISDADVYWTKLVREYGSCIDIRIAPGTDMEGLRPWYKANLLWYCLCDLYFEGGMNGAGPAKAMKSLQQYFSVTGFKDAEAKSLERLFKSAIAAAADDSGKDSVQTLCHMVSLWAHRANLGKTTLRVVSTRVDKPS